MGVRLIWCFPANLLFLRQIWGGDWGLSGNVPGAHTFLSLIFFYNQILSWQSYSKDIWRWGPHISFCSLFCLAFWQVFFFQTFFLKVPSHPVVKVHPIRLPVLIVLAVNTGWLCISRAYYQQTAFIMQIYPSHCALRLAQTIDQAIKHN